MKQVYHSNATTNVRLRSEINKSTSTNSNLCIKYGVSPKTISKWRNRSSFEDKSSRPLTIRYSLSALDQLIAVELRSLTWWSLDEITEIINPSQPEKIRSAVYRTFVREKVNKVWCNRQNGCTYFLSQNMFYLVFICQVKRSLALLESNQIRDHFDG